MNVGWVLHDAGLAAACHLGNTHDWKAEIMTRITLHALAAFASLLAWPIGEVAAQHGGIADPAEFAAERMLALWQERTEGANLALGKPVCFSPTPGYHLTIKGGTDTQDLIDGKLCALPSQTIWGEERAVGWSGSRSQSKTIIVDLGQPTAVRRVVWRVVAGCRKRNFYGPRQVRLSGGMDGRHVHLIRQRHRWRDDVAAADTYRLPNLGPPDTGDHVYVYPLVMDVENYRMRYVVLEFEMDGVWLASDELAVIAGEGEGNDIAALPQRVLQTRDVWVLSDEPRYPLLADLHLPLWLRQRDLRPNNAKLGVRYEFRLPKGVMLQGPPYYKRTDSTNGAVTLSYPRGGNSNRIGPFFVRGSPGDEGTMQVRAVGDSADPQPWLSITLDPAELPAPFRLKHVLTGIGWMVDREQEQWPDFERVYGRLGFNTVPTFPRAWAAKALQTGLDVETVQKADDPTALTDKGRRLKHLRELGYRTVYMESPLHVVNWSYPDAASEYRCQIPGRVPKEASFCPSYRGKYFQDEVRRIANHTLMAGPPDLVVWDWEMAAAGTWLGKKCSRCKESLATSGLNWDVFVKRETLGILDALNAAVRDTCDDRGWPRPQLGMYNVDAVEPYSVVFDYSKDRRWDFQSPSLYVGDDALAVRERIRAARRLGGDSRIIPWLTTATYGYVPPRSARIIVWESLLNGASGFLYYCFADFNPAHLLEIARALAAVAPLEDIVVDGTPAHDQVHVADDTIRHSALRLGDRAGLLLVNTSSEQRTVEWAWKGTATRGRTTVPGGDARLLALSLER